MGFDSFGLPAENAAIREGGHPREIVERNIVAITRDDEADGLGIDWDRVVSAHDPEYYRWTQWLFLKLFEAGLAYRKGAPVKWCPIDQVVLANEQVHDGRCEYCGAEVDLEEPRAVVLQDDRVRGRAARRPRPTSSGPTASRRCSATGSAAPRAPRSCSGSRSSTRTCRLHDAARHALRRDVLRARARASARRASWSSARRTRRAARLRAHAPARSAARSALRPRRRPASSPASSRRTR